MLETRFLRENEKLNGITGISFVAFLVFPVIGLCCLVIPDLVVDVLPYVVGAALIVSGVTSAIELFRKKPTVLEGEIIGRQLVVGILGVVTLFQGKHAIIFLGVIWGLFGLFEAGNEFDSFIRKAREKKPFIVPLLLCLLELGLALPLIVSPFYNIDNHLQILGLQLMAFPFIVWFERRKEGPKEKPDEPPKDPNP